METISLGKNIFWVQPSLGQHQILTCYRKGGCTPEGIPVNPAPEWWGSSPDKTPQANEQIEKNSRQIWNTLSTYPYPAPFLPGEGVSFFLKFLKPELVDLASANHDLEEESVKMWITLQMLANYNTWVGMIEEAAKRMAERRKKAAITRAIAVTVGSLVMGFAAPAAFAAAFSAISTAAQTYVDLQKMKAAMAALKEAYTAFAESDPAFAAEVKKAEAKMEQYEKEDEAKKAALQPVTATGTVAPLPEAPKTNALLVGGGIAAVALAAFALFRK